MDTQAQSGLSLRTRRIIRLRDTGENHVKIMRPVPDIRTAEIVVVVASDKGGQMLFLPTIIIFVLINKTWVRLLIGGIWLIGLLTSENMIIDYIIGTVMVVLATCIIRWIYRKIKRDKTATQP